MHDAPLVHLHIPPRGIGRVVWYSNGIKVSNLLESSIQPWSSKETCAHRTRSNIEVHKRHVLLLIRVSTSIGRHTAYLFGQQIRSFKAVHPQLTL